MEIVVKNSNERIDKYLSTHSEYSRATIAKMLENEYILVNNKKVKSSYKVREGDLITIDETFTEEIDIAPVAMNIDVIYEDEDIIVVNKPSGLVVHPGSGNYTNTLANGLMHYTTSLSNVNGEERPGIVHRIDKDTSGLLLIAKNNKTHAILADYFKNKKVHRKYIALLNGVFPHNSATIDAPIGRDLQNRKKMAVTAINSKNAVTHLHVIKRYEKHTLVSLELETGRTHQIRVHMNYIGYPVYNDPVYSNKTTGDFGQFLHSSEMEFIHPITGKHLQFSCPIPAEFQKYLNEIDNNQ